MLNAGNRVLGLKSLSVTYGWINNLRRYWKYTAKRRYANEDVVVGRKP